MGFMSTSKLEINNLTQNETGMYVFSTFNSQEFGMYLPEIRSQAITPSR